MTKDEIKDAIIKIARERFEKGYRQAVCKSNACLCYCCNQAREFQRLLTLLDAKGEVDLSLNAPSAKETRSVLE